MATMSNGDENSTVLTATAAQPISADCYTVTDRSTPGGGNSEVSPNPEPVPDDDDIEREAIMNEAEFDTPPTKASDRRPGLERSTPHDFTPA